VGGCQKLNSQAGITFTGLTAMTSQTNRIISRRLGGRCETVDINNDCFSGPVDDRAMAHCSKTAMYVKEYG
jgi:hypothetical protein